MDYIEVKKNKVVNIFCGPSAPEGMIEVPKNHIYRVGDDTRFYKKDHMRMTPEEAASIVTAKKDQNLIWTGHEYKAVYDFTDKAYWNKETGAPVKLKLGQKPDDTITDVARKDGAAEWKDGAWVVPDKVKADRIQATVRDKLSECDHIMLTDFPISNKKEWEDYRAALRAVNHQVAFPESVEWPVVPEVIKK